MPSSTLGLLVLVGLLVPAAADPNCADHAMEMPKPKWIWFPESVEQSQNQVRYFRQAWSLPWDPSNALLQITADDEFELRINRRKIGASKQWRDYQTYDVTRQLRRGANTLAIRARNGGGHAGVILVAKALNDAGQTEQLVTDQDWQASQDGKRWQPARVVATYPDAPWGRLPDPPSAYEHDPNEIVPDSGLRLISAMAGFMGGGIPHVDALPNVHPAKVPLYRELGLAAVAEYAYWWYLEPEPDRWDFRFSDRVHDGLAKVGLDHAVYPWFHVAPPWYQKTDRYTPLRCLEHDEEIDLCMSLWDPNATACCDRLYAAYRRHFGDRIGPIYVGIYGDFGEVMFPVAINPWWRPKCRHNHIDWWTGDRFARKDFANLCRRKYRNIDSLNKHWGSAFADFEHITYPKDEKARRWWLDFIEWRYDSMNRFTAATIRTIRKHYPKAELQILLGGGSELLYYGQDNSGLPKLSVADDVVIHSTHAGGRQMWFMAKRIATAAKHYGLKYVTEPPGKVPKEQALERLFIDAATGITTMFEYMDNIFDNAPELSRYLGLLRGDKPVCEAAVLFPTTYHRLQPIARKPGPPGALPQRLKTAFDEIHDVIDLDILDEPLIADEALAGYKLLIQFEGDIYESETLEKILSWVRGGGVLLICGERPWQTVEQQHTWPAELFEPKDPLPEVSKAAVTRVGKGSIVGLNYSWDERPAMYQAIYAIAGRLGQYSDGQKDLFLADGEADDVWTTTFADRILLSNVSRGKRVSKVLRFNHPRMGKGTEIPVTLAPQEMKAVWIDGEPERIDIVCGRHRFSPSRSAAARDVRARTTWPLLRVGPGKSVRLAANVSEGATYAVHVRILSDPPGKRVELRLPKNEVITLATQPKDSYRIPKVGQLRLAKGRIEITIRNLNRASIHADRIVLTTDTELAGHRYAITRRADLLPFGLTE